MKRALVSVVVLAVALWTCLVGRHALVGCADASDDPLTPEMKKQIDASLIVIVGEIRGEITKSRDVREKTSKCLSYKVDRYLKGTCFESQLDVRHSPAVDPAAFGVGRSVVVGFQLETGAWLDAGYGLHGTSKEFGPVAWSQALEDAVLRHVADAPRGPTVPSEESKAKLRRLECMENLSQLGQIYFMKAQENHAKSRKWSGPALWLSMRKNAAEIKRGDERVLLCPCDQSARPATSDADRKAWDDVDLTKPAPGLCSYVARDFVNFPVPVESKEKEPIGACLHHPGGVIFVFDGGDAQFMTLEELGLSSDAEKTVGPDSKSPILRVLK